MGEDALGLALHAPAIQGINLPRCLHQKLLHLLRGVPCLTFCQRRLIIPQCLHQGAVILECLHQHRIASLKLLGLLQEADAQVAHGHHAAGIRRQPSCHSPQESGLAGAVDTHNTDFVPFVDIEIYMTKKGFLAIAFAQILHCQNHCPCPRYNLLKFTIISIFRLHAITHNLFYCFAAFSSFWPFSVISTISSCSSAKGFGSFAKILVMRKLSISSTKKSLPFQLAFMPMLGGDWTLL